MNRNSIFLKLNIIFLVSLISIILVAFFILRDANKSNHRILSFKSHIIFKEIRLFNQIPFKLIDELEFNIVKQENKINILNKATIVQPPRKRFRKELNAIKQNRNKSTIRQRRRMLQNDTLNLLRYDKYNFIHIIHNDINLLIKSKYIFLGKTYTIIAIILFAIILLIIMYILLRRSILPLKKLQQDIERYGLGEEITSKYTNKKDEVSLVSNSFYSSVDKIKKIESSRNLFIRNISHELNTPITKGKILSEIINNDKQKNLLNSIFTKLSLLVKQLITTEQITSKNYILKFKKLRIQDIVDEASDLLYLDVAIPTNINQNTINADFKSMSIVFKNLIDNAIKYGKGIKIEVNSQTINFISTGEILDNPLSSNDDNFLYNKNENGFGLGLYITKKILESHNIKLKYKHTKGENIFYFKK